MQSEYLDWEGSYSGGGDGMSELSAVLAFVVLSALLASRMTREQRQEPVCKEAGSLIDETPSTGKTRDDGVPSPCRIRSSQASVGRR
jgi:hypothetical protein